MPNYNPLGPVGLAKLWELIKGRDDNIKLWFAESSTAGSTASKTATLANYTLVSDRIVCVKFANDNTAASPTLNINSTGDIPLYYLGSAVAADVIKANVMYVMRYNGTQYDLIGIAPPSVMDGATSQAAGAAGLVPAPAAGDDVKYLKGDATWGTPTDTQNTAGATDTSNQIYLIGAASQGQAEQTYSQDTAYIGSDGEVYSGSKKVAHQEDLDKTNGAMAIVATGNTAPKAISAGQFVLWGGNLYTANSAIASGATLSTSNLTAVPNGGLNKLNDGLTSLNSNLSTLSGIVGGKVDMIDLGNPATIAEIWDAINVYDRPVICKWNKSGKFWGLFYKYTGGQFGMGIYQVYYSTNLTIVSVSGGTITQKNIVGT